MLRLKGQTRLGEWVEFWVHDIVLPSVDLSCVWVRGEYSTNVLTATIQLADDQRKAMLENVRDRFLWLFGNNKTHSIISLVQVNSIIDEMEAKL